MRSCAPIHAFPFHVCSPHMDDRNEYSTVSHRGTHVLAGSREEVKEVPTLVKRPCAVLTMRLFCTSHIHTLAFALFTLRLRPCCFISNGGLALFIAQCHSPPTHPPKHRMVYGLLLDGWAKLLPILRTPAMLTSMPGLRSCLIIQTAGLWTEACKPTLAPNTP